MADTLVRHQRVRAAADAFRESKSDGQHAEPTTESDAKEKDGDAVSDTSDHSAGDTENRNQSAWGRLQRKFRVLTMMGFAKAKTWKRVRRNWSGLKGALKARIALPENASSMADVLRSPGTAGELNRSNGTTKCKRACFAPRRTNLPPSHRSDVRAAVLGEPHKVSVDPECLFNDARKAVHFTAILCQTFLVPFLFAFNHEITEGKWAPSLGGACLMLYALDIVFVSDSIATVLTGFVEAGNKVMDRRAIVRRYVTSASFVVDVLSVLPYDLIIYMTASGMVSRYLFMWRMTRLLRCVYLPALFSAAESAGGIHWRNMNQVLKMLTYTLLTLHVLGSLWFRTSIEYGFSHDGPADTDVVGDRADYPRPFLADPVLRDESVAVQYVMSLYFAVRSATSESLTGRSNPSNAAESLLNLFVTLAGILLVSYLIGAVGRLVGQLDASWSRHRTRLALVRRFLRHHNLSKELEDEVTEFFDFNYEESGGRNIASVAQDLSVTLRDEVALFLTHSILKKIPLFARAEEGFLISLVKTMTSVTVQRGQLVMRAGLPCKRLYLVHWGSLGVEVGDRETVSPVAGHAHGGVSQGTTPARLKPLVLSRSPWAARLANESDMAATSLRNLYDPTLEESDDESGRSSRVVDTLGPGHFIGRYTRDVRGFVPPTSVRAKTFCILYVVEHAAMTSLLQRYPATKARIERFLLRQRRGSLGYRRPSQDADSHAIRSRLRPGRGCCGAACFGACRLAGRVYPEQCKRCVAATARVSGFSWLSQGCFIRGVRHEGRVGAYAAADTPDGMSPRESSSPLAHPVPTHGIKRKASRARAAIRAGAWAVRSVVAAHKTHDGVSTYGSRRALNSSTKLSSHSLSDLGLDGAVSADGPLVIFPLSRFCTLWSIVVHMTVLFNVVIVPILVAFDDRMSAAAASKLAAGNTFCDVVYIADMFLKARTAYYDRGLCVTDPDHIWRRYRLRGGFWTDLVAAMPVDWCLAAAGDFSSVSHWARLLKLLRAPRLGRWVESTAAQHINADEAKLAVATSLVRLVFLLLFTFHFVSCVYWMFASASRGASRKWSDNTFAAPPSLHDTTSVLQLYIFSVNVVVRPGGLLRTTTPPSVDAAVFAIVVSILGVYLFAFAVGALGRAIADSDSTAAEFRKRQLSIEVFMSQRRIPAEMRDRVMHYFAVEWSSAHGLRAESICSELPSVLARRLRFELYRAPLRRTAAFCTASDRELAQLADVVTAESQAEGQVVFRATEVGDSVWIIAAGAVSLYFGPDAFQRIAEVGGAVGTGNSYVSRLARASSASSGAAMAAGGTEPRSSRGKLPPVVPRGRQASQRAEPESKSHEDDASSPVSARPTIVSDSVMQEVMAKPFTTIGPAEIAGEFAYFEGVRLTTAVTRCASELLSIRYVDLFHILDRNPLLEARLRLVARRKLKVMQTILNDAVAAHTTPRPRTRASQKRTKLSDPEDGRAVEGGDGSDTSTPRVVLGHNSSDVGGEKSDDSGLLGLEREDDDDASRPARRDASSRGVSSTDRAPGAADGAEGKAEKRLNGLSPTIQSPPTEADLLLQAELEAAGLVVEESVVPSRSWSPPPMAASGHLRESHFIDDEMMENALGMPPTIGPSPVLNRKRPAGQPRTLPTLGTTQRGVGGTKVAPSSP